MFRWWTVESISGKPGAPASRVIADAIVGGACTLAIAFRAAGRHDFAIGRPRPLVLADFDAVWTLIDRRDLIVVEPRPLPHRILDPPTVTIALGCDRWQHAWSWTSPSTADAMFADVLAVAIDLARRIGRAEPRYFPPSR
jgi:hypothetical protein